MIPTASTHLQLSYQSALRVRQWRRKAPKIPHIWRGAERKNRVRYETLPQNCQICFYFRILNAFNAFSHNFFIFIVSKDWWFFSGLSRLTDKNLKGLEISLNKKHNGTIQKRYKYKTKKIKEEWRVRARERAKKVSPNDNEK